MMTRRHLLTVSAAGITLSATGLVPYGFAQLGGKTARMLVGYPAGGNADFVARLLANEMKGYSSAVIVENRSGGGGRIALDGLRTSPADGSTMILTPGSMITLYPHIFKALKYDALRDFIPATNICSFPYLLTIGPMVPSQVKTLADFIVWCRTNQNQATYGTGGVGTPLDFTVSCWRAPPILNLFACRIRAQRLPLRISWEAKSPRPSFRSILRSRISNPDTFGRWRQPGHSGASCFLMCRLPERPDIQGSKLSIG
jgi:hypothetical protein